MTHFIIFALVLYVLFRAAIRPRKTGPTEGRLVPRGEFRPLPMQRAAIDQILERERDAREVNETAQERYRVARSGRLHQLNHPELY